MSRNGSKSTLDKQNFWRPINVCFVVSKGAALIIWAQYSVGQFLFIYLIYLIFFYILFWVRTFGQSLNHAKPCLTKKGLNSKLILVLLMCMNSVRFSKAIKLVFRLFGFLKSIIQSTSVSDSLFHVQKRRIK